MKKHFLLLTTLLMACAMVFSFTACGGDDDGGSGSGSGGGSSSYGRWYIPSNAISQKVNELSEGVNSYGNGMYQSDFFQSDGEFEFPRFHRGERNDGIMYAYPSEWKSEGLAAIHFINDNTIEACFTPRTYQLGSSGTTGKTLLYTLDMGFVGMLGVYASYTRLFTIYSDGNSFWFSDGEEVFCEFNYVNGQLYMNGGGTWVQYDPNQVHQGYVNVTEGNPNGGNNSGGGNSGGNNSGGGSSSSTVQLSLNDMLNKVLGTLSTNPQTAKYSAVKKALDNASYKYSEYEYDNGTQKFISVYPYDNSGLANYTYKGSEFYAFHCHMGVWDSVQEFSYSFKVPKESMDKKITEVLSDFTAIGHTLSVDTKMLEYYPDNYYAYYSSRPGTYFYEHCFFYVNGYNDTFVNFTIGRYN